MPFVLDAYAARSCPLKTANAFDPTLEPPAREPAPPPFFHDAVKGEADVVARLASGGVQLADLRGLRGRPSAEQEAACLAALADGVEVVAGGLLPRDWDTHRSGRPTLLVRAPDESGYHPVQVKFHRVLEGAGGDDAGEVAYSPIDAPRVRGRLEGRRFRWSTRLNAALQVAHLWRLLESTGHAASAPWAGLVGTDLIGLGEGAPRPQPLITWIDLAVPHVRSGHGTVSTLERYDDEHRLRVDLAEAALDPAPRALPEPVFTRECTPCVWRSHCAARLHPDDLSLRINKAPLDVREVQALRSLGVTTVTDLARANLEELVDAYVPHVSHRPGGEQRLRLLRRRAVLLDAGVAVERQGGGAIDLPRHDLEVDIDIETSADDRVYLWGFLVDDAASGGDPVYHHVSAFGDLDDDAEVALAREAFTWLRDRLAGRDAAVYHYSDYEVLRVSRLAAASGDDLGAWARSCAEEHFVDLFDVVRHHFFGANGLGLKVVAAALAGFAWRDDDPGGLNSQRWFAEAVHDPDADVRARARTRVLEYNEDDVRATWHLRRRLREPD